MIWDIVFLNTLLKPFATLVVIMLSLTLFCAFARYVVQTAWDIEDLNCRPHKYSRRG